MNEELHTAQTGKYCPNCKLSTSGYCDEHLPHIPAPTGEECKHKKALRNSGITPPEGYTCRVCHPSLAQPQWEERFDEEMMLANFGFGEANQKRLKSFISTLLASERARLEEEIGSRCWEHEKSAREAERARLREKVEIALAYNVDEETAKRMLAALDAVLGEIK